MSEQGTRYLSFSFLFSPIVIYILSIFRCPGYYSALNVQFDASADAIAKGFKRQALKWHPDRNRGNGDEASKRFQFVKLAHTTLSVKKTHSVSLVSVFPYFCSSILFMICYFFFFYPIVLPFAGTRYQGELRSNFRIEVLRQPVRWGCGRDAGSVPVFSRGEEKWKGKRPRTFDQGVHVILWTMYSKQHCNIIYLSFISLISFAGKCRIGTKMKWPRVLILTRLVPLPAWRTRQNCLSRLVGKPMNTIVPLPLSRLSWLQFSEASWPTVYLSNRMIRWYAITPAAITIFESFFIIIFIFIFFNEKLTCVVDCFLQPVTCPKCSERTASKTRRNEDVCKVRVTSMKILCFLWILCLATLIKTVPRRWVMLGRTGILVFRDEAFMHLVNMHSFVHVDYHVVREESDSLDFMLQSPHHSIHFRAESLVGLLDC